MGGELLFKAPLCRNQAFWFHNAYGLQFRLEVIEELLKEWFAKDPEPNSFVAKYHVREEGLRRMVNTLGKRLLGLGSFDEEGYQKVD